MSGHEVGDIALLNTLSQSYGVSLVIWDHTVLPAARHKWTQPALTQPSMESWVDLGGRVHTEIVYQESTYEELPVKQLTI